VYLRAGRHEDAVKAFKKSLELKPDQPACHYDLGLVAMRTSDLAEAEKQFRKSLELNPDDTRAIFNLGKVLRRSGQTALAEKVLTEFNRRQDLQAQAKALEAAVRAHPEDLNSLYMLGETLLKLNKLDEGVGCYLKILAIDPAHKKTLRTLVGMYLQLGYVHNAIETIRKAEAAAPDDEEIKAMKRQLEEAIKK